MGKFLGFLQFRSRRCISLTSGSQAFVQVISTIDLRYEETVEPFVGGAIGIANLAGIGGV